MNFKVYKQYQDAKKYNAQQRHVDDTIANAMQVLKDYTKGSDTENFVAQVAINALNDLANLRLREKDKGMDK